MISEPDPFCHLVVELIEKNVQDLDRIREVEARMMFNPAQSARFSSVYDPGESPAIREIAARSCSRHVAEQFTLASRWFAWRGNEELAQRYIERARVAYEILSEKETQNNGR